jgi:hypothetical protein
MFASIRLTALGLVAFLALPAAAQPARLQVIHNAADPVAAAVDVYVNGARLLDDFAFREATPFIDVPPGVPLSVAIAPGNSTSAGDAVYTESFTLPAGSTTQLIANGVLNPPAFAANPDGRSTGFALLVGASAQESSGNAANVAIRVVHGATDAPTVDVRGNGALLVNDAAYADITGYLEVPAAAYTVGITLADGTPVAAFSADLAAAGGGAATVLASGFLDPAANQNGAAFGLLAVFPDGTTAMLPASTTARLQVIHNAADPAAAVVDVYVNGARLLDDFAFRSATPFIDVPGGTTLSVAIAPGNSTDVGDAIYTEAFTLPAGTTTQLVANGVLNPGAFAVNPDGRPTGFALLVGADAREASADFGQTAVRVVHGATDAPTVDVRSDGAVLVDNAAYRDITGFLGVRPALYTLNITLADGTPVVSFVADLSAAGGAAVTALASGFLDPTANQNGPAFGLLAVFADGTTALLSTTVDAEDGPQTGALGLGVPTPNPLSERGTVAFSLDRPGPATLALYDVAGRRVAVLADGEYGAERQEAEVSSAGLAPGTYILRLQAPSGVVSRTLAVVR